MKATVDKENWKIELDNDAIKAIRFVNGFNTDLRISLKGINEKSLWFYLSDNEIPLFGTCMMDLHPDPTSKDWDKYGKMLNDVVRQIVR